MIIAQSEGHTDGRTNPESIYITENIYAYFPVRSLQRFVGLELIEM